MKKLIILGFVLLAFCSLKVPILAQQNSLDGYWEGIANIPNDEVKFSVTFKTEADGIKGKINIPDAGFIFGSPVSNLSVDNSKIHFEVPRLRDLPFDGKISGDSITGTFPFNKLIVTFVLKRSKAQQLFHEEEVRIKNGNVTLTGTLLVPNAKGRHPAIVFHHAAYADTRESWRFFADYFARLGVATLIYDNRGAGDSTGYPRADFDDLAGDVLAIIEQLKSRPDINPKQIGIWGGSQAGWISPLVAARSKDVAFIMMMSGPGVSLARNVLYESETKLRAAGFSEEEIKRALIAKKSIEDTARAESWEKAEPLIQKVKSEKWFSEIGVSDKNSWFRWWWTMVGNYDPAPVWEKVKVPVLNVEGELDMNVPANESLERMGQSLKKGGNKDFTSKIFSKADHSILIITEQGRYRLAPGFLDFITDWLLKRVSVKG